MDLKPVMMDLSHAWNYQKKNKNSEKLWNTWNNCIMFININNHPIILSSDNK